MPADFPALLDTLLVIAGLVLVVTGLVMFIRSKTSTQASSVEAFGIKLNVTHPSLILVLAGVGLMLAPRLLPDLREREPKPAVVAEATPPAAPPQSTPAAASPAAPAAATRPAPPAPVPLPYPGMATAARPAPGAATPRAAAPKPTAPSPPKKATPAVASTSAAVATHAEASPAPQAARPALAYAALGLPTGRSFWSGETRASYTRRMQAALQQAGRGVLRMEPREMPLGEREFDAWWNESNARPKSRELCAASPPPAALLAARVETPTAISSAESAYWPELKLRLYVCATQRLHRQQKTLAPQNDDAWPFAGELHGEIERFLRAYRDDLATD